MSSEDKIRKQFQSKFNDFKVPVPADGWARLEESLNNASVVRKMVVHRRWQYAGSAAAVLVLLVVSLFFLNKPTVTEGPFMSETMPPANDVITEPEIESKIDIRVAEPALFAERKVASSVSKQPSNVSAIFTELIEQEKQQVSDDLIGLSNEVTSINDDIMFDVADNSGNYNMTEEQIIIEGDEIVLLAENESGSDKENYILSFGSKGGLTSFHQTVNSPMALRSAALAEENQLIEQPGKVLFQSAASTDNTLEMEHNQPVSFGITVSKLLFDDLYIETGLIYSYLYSKRKNTSANSFVERKQQFHYLGIPLNVNYNLFSLGKLNVYTSIGGMIEKDVYGRLTEQSEIQLIGDNAESEGLMDKTISQHNPQISVNAGIGLSYPIYQNFKLYGKIGGAYYFDANNQYPTIYSDSKIVMDLNLGIRYEF